MKAIRVAIATFAVLTASSGVARADIIMLGATPTAAFVDLTAQGFGNNPRLLTLQTTGIESGFETPVDVENGDAVDGANKSQTPTLASLGWNVGADVGIGFNSNQVGQTGITLQDMVLKIYSGTTVVGTFNLTNSMKGFTFTAADLALQQGNGAAVFGFGLDAAQQATFNTMLLLAGSANFTAGLGATLGCPANAPVSCNPSNDGPDSFIGYDRASVTVPDGGTTVGLLGLGMLGVGYLRRRLG